MTLDDLIAFGLSPERAAQWVDPLNQTFEQFDISTPERQAAFLGQCAHESANFTTLTENLNYSAEALCKVWPKRFPSMDVAGPYHRNPEMIANRAYSDRMGNGPEESGDGWKYRGRGLIQLTGKDNYRACGSSLGIDLITNPELVSVPDYAARTAGWFWQKNHLNDIADTKDWFTLTKRINGGTHGLEDRIAKTDKALSVLA